MVCGAMNGVREATRNNKKYQRKGLRGAKADFLRDSATSVTIVFEAT